YALGNGPRLVYARPPSSTAVAWLPARQEPSAVPGTHHLATAQLANVVEVELDLPRPTPYGGARIELSPDGKRWKTIYDSTRRPGDGSRYDFPPQQVAAVRVSNARRSNGQTAEVKAVRVGYEAARFPAEAAVGGEVSSGQGPDSKEGFVAWIEVRGAFGLDRFRWSMNGAGALRLDYSYTLTGELVYHGVTFDHTEDAM